MAMASMLLAHAALCLDFSSKLILDCAMFCYDKSHDDFEAQALKLVYPAQFEGNPFQDRETAAVLSEQEKEFMDSYVRLVDRYQDVHPDYNGQVRHQYLPEKEIINRMNDSLTQFVLRELKKDAKRKSHRVRNPPIDLVTRNSIRTLKMQADGFIHEEEEDAINSRSFDIDDLDLFDEEVDNNDDVIEEYVDYEEVEEEEEEDDDDIDYRPLRRRRPKWRRRPQKYARRRFRPKRRRPQSRGLWPFNKKRANKRKQHYRPPPHPYRPPPVPHTTSMRHALLSFFPAFLSMGGLLGFGISAYLDDSDIEEQETNTFTFTPTITIEGDTVDTTVTNSDTNTNTNSATNTDNDVITATNTATNEVAINQTVINILIDTETGNVTVTTIGGGRSFDEDEEGDDELFTLLTGNAFNARLAVFLMKKLANLARLPFIFDVEEFSLYSDNDDFDWDEKEKKKTTKNNGLFSIFSGLSSFLS